MAGPAESATESALRDLAEKVLPGGGAPRERFQAVADDLVERGKLSRADADVLVDDLVSSSRGSGRRLTDRATGAISALADQLGVVRERQLDELELRVAQLEHRLRLLEADADRAGPGTPSR